jgi:hypothetical protein
MYTRDTEACAIDSVACVNAVVKRHPYSPETPTIELTMAYVSRALQLTYGTCPIQTQVLSSETLGHLKAFLDGAEKDFGKVIFGAGHITFDAAAPMKPGAIETAAGLPKIGIGGTHGGT